MKAILLFFSVAFTFTVKGQNNLYAAYLFNGNANDSSGNGLNGILHGTPALTSDRFGNGNAVTLEI